MVLTFSDIYIFTFRLQKGPSAMDGPSSNLLDLARSAAISPYQPTVSTMASLGSPNISPQDSRPHRPLNGWTYQNEVSAAAAAGCNFPYPAPPHGLGGAGGTSLPNKPSPYPSFNPGSDFLPNCQQVPLNQLSPLNSLPTRNFSFYGDMYNTNPGPGMGGGLFSDLSMSTIPRFDDGTTYMTDNCSSNPG